MPNSDLSKIKWEYQLRYVDGVLVARRGLDTLSLQELKALVSELNDTVELMEDNYFTHTEHIIRDHHARTLFGRDLMLTRNIRYDHIYTTPFIRGNRDRIAERNLVYIISIPSKPEMGYKIGRTGNISNRMMGFRMEFEAAIKLHYAFVGDECVRTEWNFHKTFSDKQISGEWFDLGQEWLDYIWMVLPPSNKEDLRAVEFGKKGK